MISSSSCISIFRQQPQSPRAIAIILGPLGASATMLQRIADDLYPHCSVIAAASPPLKFMRNSSMAPEAREVWEACLDMMMQQPPVEYESVPLILHSFSNGGCFLLDAMEQDFDVLHGNDDASVTTTTRGTASPNPMQQRNNISLLHRKLADGVWIYDSCPCYIRMAWDWEHFAQSFPHPQWTAPGRFLYTLAASWSLTAWCLGTLSPSRPRLFWQRMLASRPGRHEVYIYSSCDMLSDAAAVDRLIAYKRRQHTNNEDSIQQFRFENSNHCRIHLDHPVEYTRIVNQAIVSATERTTKRQHETNQQHGSK